MANSLYALGREAFLGGDLDWDANNIKASLLDGADYTPNLSTHDFWDDVPSGAVVADSSNLASKTKVNGTADAADVVWSTVTGDPSEYISYRADSGSSATSRLIGLMDTATGLPVTPNGGNINLTFNASGIFTL